MEGDEFGLVVAEDGKVLWVGIWEADAEADCGGKEHVASFVHLLEEDLGCVN